MAFLQETPQPFFRVPAIVIALIALLVGIEVSREVFWSASSQAAYYNYGFVPARYSHAFLATHDYYAGTLFQRAVPFVSYTFLHGSFTHVAINSIWLLAFGAVVARRYGGLLFLVFFLMCGVAGAATHLISAWGSTAPVVGASAAVSGLMGAAFRMIVPSTQGQRSDLVPLWSRQILLWSLVWIGVNIVAGLTGLGAGPGPHLIAWQAHIGGYIAGLLLAGPFDSLASRFTRTGALPA